MDNIYNTAQNVGFRTDFNINQATIPTVRGLDEAAEICHLFDGVLTAGPSAPEVQHFGHHNHKIVVFEDVSLPYWPESPSIRNVEEMLDWASGQKNLLVHCHAGISRSTATAWGIAIANGHSPQEALATLWELHPIEMRPHKREYLKKREFSPNHLIIEHLEKVLGYHKGILNIMRDQFLASKNTNSN